MLLVTNSEFSIIKRYLKGEVFKQNDIYPKEREVLESFIRKQYATRRDGIYYLNKSIRSLAEQGQVKAM